MLVDTWKVWLSPDWEFVNQQDGGGFVQTDDDRGQVHIIQKYAVGQIPKPVLRLRSVIEGS